MKDYEIVHYHNRLYCVCRYIKKNGTEKLFVIDESDLKKIFICSDKWYKINQYVGCTKIVNNKSVPFYLHHLIMNYQNSRFKGEQHVIIHINGNTHDNRKSNLKIMNETDIKDRRITRKRKCQLPVGCRIKISDIPKNVYYIKPQSNHGELFIIELIHDGKKYVWKSSSSHHITLEDKLVEIKKKLLDIEKHYPWLITNKLNEQIKLTTEFNDIVMQSGYSCKTANLMHVPQKTSAPNINQTFNQTKKYLKTNTAIKSGRRHVNRLPDGCGIVPSMIPTYCYYQSANHKRGDAFIIDHHPFLPNGKRSWSTTTSKTVDIREKYKQLLTKLRELRRERSSGSKTAKKLKINKNR